MGRFSAGNQVRRLDIIYPFIYLFIHLERWLYSLIMAEDANFKQKARLRPKTSKDPPLGPGWATFVQNDAYLQHLAKFIDQDEVI